MGKFTSIIINRDKQPMAAISTYGRHDAIQDSMSAFILRVGIRWAFGSECPRECHAVRLASTSA
jgi:hypothetical protein